jgi:hypothetical protein
VTDIAVGQQSAPDADPSGDAWILGCQLYGTGYEIYQLQFLGPLGVGPFWVPINGLGVHISVSPDLGVPWVVDAAGHIYE